MARKDLRKGRGAKVVWARPLGLADAVPWGMRVSHARGHLIELLDRPEYFEAYQRLLRSKPPPPKLEKIIGGLPTEIGVLAESMDLDRAIKGKLARVVRVNARPAGRPRRVRLEVIQKVDGALIHPEFQSRWGQIPLKQQVRQLARILSTAFADSESEASRARQVAGFVELVYERLRRFRRDQQTM